MSRTTISSISSTNTPILHFHWEIRMKIFLKWILRIKTLAASRKRVTNSWLRKIWSLLTQINYLNNKKTLFILKENPSKGSKYLAWSQPILRSTCHPFIKVKAHRRSQWSLWTNNLCEVVITTNLLWDKRSIPNRSSLWYWVNQKTTHKL